jgi:hypothetical protein
MGAFQIDVLANSFKMCRSYVTWFIDMVFKAPKDEPLVTAFYQHQEGPVRRNINGRQIEKYLNTSPPDWEIHAS